MPRQGHATQDVEHHNHGEYSSRRQLWFEAYLAVNASASSIGRDDEQLGRVVSMLDNPLVGWTPYRPGFRALSQDHDRCPWPDDFYHSVSTAFARRF